MGASQKKKIVRNHPRTPEEAEANLRRLFLRYSKTVDKLHIPLLNVIQEISIKSRIIKKS